MAELSSLAAADFELLLRRGRKVRRSAKARPVRRRELPLHRGKIGAGDVLGLDLGDGETSLAIVANPLPPGPRRVATILIDKRYSIPTAFATSGDIVLLGNAAIEDQRGKALDGLYINFKQPPSHPEAAKARDRIVKFMNALRATLVKSGALGGDTYPHVYVGCPGGWSKQDRDVYESWLRSSAFKNVSVTRETRCAMREMIEALSVARRKFEDRALVIDIGSSTTDVTLVERLKEDSPIDTGIALGAAALDFKIAEIVLDRPRQGKEEEEARGHLQIELQRNPESPLFRRFVFHCRLLKEEYYSMQRDVRSTFKFGGMKLEVVIDETVVDLAEASPVKIGEARNTWSGHFSTLLSDTRKRIDRTIPSSNERIPLTILLTGGASRMPFVASDVELAFSGTRYDVTLLIDHKPEVTIAHGAARWGRIEVLTADFGRKAAGVIGDLPNIVVRQVPALPGAVAQFIANDVRTIMLACYRRWRDDSNISNSDRDDEIANNIRSWINGEEGSRKVVDGINRWLFGPMGEVLRRTFESLSSAYEIDIGRIIVSRLDISAIKLTVNLDEGFLRWIAELLRSFWDWLFNDRRALTDAELVRRVDERLPRVLERIASEIPKTREWREIVIPAIRAAVDLAVEQGIDRAKMLLVSKQAV